MRRAKFLLFVLAVAAVVASLPARALTLTCQEKCAHLLATCHGDPEFCGEVYDECISNCPS
jgi:hypothetical protein